jgi:glycyl-tRNA synthetase beta chain
MLGKEFILEIGTEEIPANHMNDIIEQLRVLTANGFEDKRIQYGSIAVYGTPRRIVLHAEGMAESQTDLVREIKGPPVRISYDESGNPTKAAIGFAKSQGIDVSDLQVRTIDSGDYIFAVLREPGSPVQEVLQSICPEIILSLKFKKSMKWGCKDIRFIRPIRWLLAVFGGQAVEFELEGVYSKNVTFGHRLLSPGAIQVTNWRKYVQDLEQAYVIVDQNRRKQLIRDGATEVAGAVGGQAVMDGDLLDEVTYLVEYPTAFLGRFETDFLNLPVEVLITSMKEHQRYFPVVSEKGALLPYFVGVRNGNRGEIDTVRAGNEKVLRARLQDARFFYEEDTKVELVERVSELSGIVFQENLGTMLDKIHRVTRLSNVIANLLGSEDTSGVERTAMLCKADLVTNMVREFPELQGVMGREYASLSGETCSVAEGIYEHYLPRFAEDSVPKTIEGIVVGIADKLDTLVGCFGVGLAPTGSQDPYALRRQAAGILRICDECRLDVSIDKLIEEALHLFDGIQDFATDLECVRTDVKSFVMGRWVTLLLSKGISREIADAVLLIYNEYVPQSVNMSMALNSVYQEPWFRQLLTSFTRAWNITKRVDAARVSYSLFKDEAERELQSAVERVSETVDARIGMRDYTEAILSLKELAEPIDVFFERVLVMDEDEKIRENRLGLLQNVVRTMCKIGDLTVLYGAR